jgi:hypothetical protein
MVDFEPTPVRGSRPDERARAEAAAGSNPPFWIYANRHQMYECVHLADCGHCNHGEGAHRVLESVVGEWLPFASYEAAWSWAGSYERRDCQICIPRGEIDGSQVT